MGQRKHNRTAGFSLIEVVVGIALLGLVTAPVCASLVLSVRLNSHSQALMDARLQASGVVETLLAEGIYLRLDAEGNPSADSDYEEISEGWQMKPEIAPQGVVVSVAEVSGEPYYAVTVSSTVAGEDVKFTTHIRKEGGA